MGIRTTSAVAAAVAALTLSACGGGDETSTTDTTAPNSDLAAQPEPVESIETAQAAFNESIAAGDCDAFAALQHSGVRGNPDPEAPAAEGECKFLEDGPMAQLEGVEFTESAEFGTGAVTEAPDAAGGGVYSLWILDFDGKYRTFATSFPGADQQIGVDPAGDPMPTAEAFVEAIRADDCKAMVPLLNPDGTLVQQVGQGDPKTACEAVVGGQILAPALEATPDAELTDFGGTLDNTFVGLATKDDYFTIALATPTGDPDAPQSTEMLVFDVLSNTREPASAPSVEDPAE